ncbi:MAG: hypothetical protein II949_04590 [Prevotella sp.]|nr:hypothetical protein [Prevotella sp.]
MARQGQCSREGRPQLGRSIPELRSPTRSLCASPLARQGECANNHSREHWLFEPTGWHGACPYTGGFASQTALLIIC